MVRSLTEMATVRGTVVGYQEACALQAPTVHLLDKMQKAWHGRIVILRGFSSNRSVFETKFYSRVSLQSDKITHGTVCR